MFLFQTATRAQTILWAKQSNGDTYASRTVVDKNDNAYVFGSFESVISFDATTLTPNGIGDIFLAKYDPDGNVLWVKQMGGPTWDQGSDIVINTDGDLLVTGIMSEGGPFLSATLDKNDGGAFFAKIDPDGNLKWIKQYGGIYGQGYAIATDSHNNVIVSGRISLEDGTIAKYTTDGDFEWSNLIDYQSCCVYIIIGHLAVDSNDNILLSGTMSGFTSFSGHILYADGFFSMFITKLDPLGHFLWYNQADTRQSLSEARGNDIEFDDITNVYLTGSFENIAHFGAITLQSKYGERNGFIAKLSSSGNYEWVKPIYSEDQTFADLAKDNHHQLYLVGSGIRNLEYEGYLYSEPGSFGFILKIDPEGGFQNSLIISNRGIAGTNQLNFNSVDDFYATGFFNDKLALGCDTLDSNNTFFYDFYIFKNGIPPFLNIVGTELCSNGITTLTVPPVNHAVRYTWGLPDGVSPVSGSVATTANSIVVTSTRNLENIPVGITVDRPCYLSTGSVFISNIYGTVHIPDSIYSPPSVCRGDTLTISVPAFDSAEGYLWDLPVGVSFYTGNAMLSNKIKINISHNFSGGNFQVRAFNHCDSSAFVQKPMTVYSDPLPPEITGPDTVCTSQKKVVFTASTMPNAVGYQWIVPIGMSVSPGFASDSTRIDLDFSTTFASASLKIIALGRCLNSSPSTPFIVNAYPAPSLSGSIAGPDKVCHDETAHYSLSTVDFVDHLEWSLPPEFTTVGTATQNSIDLHISETANSGTLQVLGINRCEESAAVQLNIQVISIPEKPGLFTDNCHRVISTRSNDTLNWYWNDTLLPNHDQTLSVQDSGVFKVSAQNFCGSVESDPLSITLIEVDHLQIPNVITPGDDGANDLFVIDKALAKSSLIVIDRWGSTVFETDNYSNDWNGNNVNPGVYYYLIRNSCLPEPIKGIIQVVK